jgi:hypothetical protein
MLRSRFAAALAFDALALAAAPADSAPGRGALFPVGRHIAAVAVAAAASPGAGRDPGAPAGCPRRLFCGCGAAVRIFGRPVRELWLAASWFRFPRAAPGPGRVAVRRHHVFVLEQHLVGDVWLVFDANSGRHATQLHPRSIAGFVIVDPC